MENIIHIRHYQICLLTNYILSVLSYYNCYEFMISVDVIPNIIIIITITIIILCNHRRMS